MMRARGAASEHDIMTFGGSAALRNRHAPALAALRRRHALRWSLWPAAVRRPPAENAEIAKRRAAERKTFTDAEIIDGFFKVTFGAEFHVAGGVDRIRKYDGPVRVYHRQPRASPTARTQVAAVVADIRARIRDLDIAMTDKRDDAKSSCRWCATAISRAPSARSTASTGRAASSARSSRNACPASARTRTSASCIPT